MTSPTDYLAAATILALQEINTDDGEEVPTHVEDIAGLLHATYTVQINDARLWIVIKKLENLEMVEVIRDAYAGNLIHIKKSLFDASPQMLAQVLDPHVIRAVAIGGNSLFERVFESPEFWANLDVEADALESGYKSVTSYVYGSMIPASDRIVRLSHNQQCDLEIPLDEVLSLVAVENTIDGEDGIRELTLGRLRAGRELLRAGIFSLQSLQLTLVVGLKLLAEKYGDHAIGALAGKLLDLLLKQFGIG